MSIGMVSEVISDESDVFSVDSIELIEISMLVCAVVKKLLETLSSSVLVMLSLVADGVGVEVWIGDPAAEDVATRV